MSKHQQGNVAKGSPADDDEVKDSKVCDGNVIANDGIVGYSDDEDSGDGASSGAKGNGVSGGVTGNGYASSIDYCVDNDGNGDCCRWRRQ